MGNDYFAAFLNEVYDRFCSDLYGLHLLRKGISQCISSQGDDNAFFFLFSIVKIPLVLPKISIFADQKTKYGLKRAAGPGVRLKLRLTQAM